WNQEEADGVKPTYVEKEFGFTLGPNRVRGRYDRVDEDLLGAVIIDYKTSEVTRQKDADRRVAGSLQLKMYALAWRELTGALRPLRPAAGHDARAGQRDGRHVRRDRDARQRSRAARLLGRLVRPLSCARADDRRHRTRPRRPPRRGQARRGCQSGDGLALR